MHVLDTTVRFGGENANGTYNACVSVLVRVTLRDGTVREDRGGGFPEFMRKEGEAILKAEKEAVTDAKKRAFKNFVNRLGLCVYNRLYTSRKVPTQAIAARSVFQAKYPPCSTSGTGAMIRSNVAGPSGAGALPGSISDNPSFGNGSASGNPSESKIPYRAAAAGASSMVPKNGINNARDPRKQYSHPNTRNNSIPPVKHNGSRGSECNTNPGVNYRNAYGPGNNHGVHSGSMGSVDDMNGSINLRNTAYTQERNIYSGTGNNSRSNN